MVQRRLDKIYDWESKFALRPTRSLIKYLRAVLRESANAAAAVAADPLGSGAMGMIYIIFSVAKYVPLRIEKLHTET